jgi:hypothetical protein
MLGGTRRHLVNEHPGLLIFVKDWLVPQIAHTSFCFAPFCVVDASTESRRQRGAAMTVPARELHDATHSCWRFFAKLHVLLLESTMQRLKGHHVPKPLDGDLSYPGHRSPIVGVCAHLRGSNVPHTKVSLRSNFVGGKWSSTTSEPRVLGYTSALL